MAPSTEVVVGNGSHWTITGATSIYQATATGFRVYIRFSSGAALTPAYANTLHWHIHWQGRQEIISKYYRFSGQLIAMHKGPALQYLHTDRLPSRRGSIAEVTNQSGGHITQQTYYAGACPELDWEARSGVVAPYQPRITS